MSKKKIITIILFFTIVLTFINLDNIREVVKNHLAPESKLYIKELFFGKTFVDRINLLKIGQKNLPQTEFENIKLKKIEIKNLSGTTNTHYNKVKGTKKILKKFFIENIKDDLLILDNKGAIKYLYNINAESYKDIPSNLDDMKITTILDVALIKDELFISLSSKKNPEDKCSYFYLVKSKFNTKELIFSNFFGNKICLNDIMSLGGRIHEFNYNSVEGVLLTTGASGREKNLAQDDNSIQGKILFLPLDGTDYKIFSKGHRNPQGLTINSGIILSTEHGPYGGDEINKISFGKNYGFPISSYGEKYNYFNGVFKSRSDYIYKKNHAKNNFEEPIFSYVPSIGISEIIKVPNGFSKYWSDNYLVTSLNNRSIYRVKFDEEFSKILFSERIVVGERIRDIKFMKNLNSFVLALEETGSLGILQSPQSKKIN